VLAGACGFAAAHPNDASSCAERRNLARVTC
jgi:hypothetical protein